MRDYLLGGALLFLVLGTSPTEGAAPPPRVGLAESIEVVIGDPAYRHSRWGLLVVDADSRTVLYEHNADQLFAPASVTKLYSCAAALVALGADHRFETPVYARGPRVDGTLKGDLVLVAKGDLTLGGRTLAGGEKGAEKMAFTNDDHIYAGPTSTGTTLTPTDPLAGLKDLARQVKEKGVKVVTGDVLIDDRLFERSRGSGSGPGIVTPIVVNDNVVDVTITPASKPGQKATWALRPQTDFIQVDVQVDTVERGRGNVRVGVENVGPQRYVVRGQVPAGGKPIVRICSVDDPVGFARALFLDCLRKEGVQVRASALRAPRAELPSAGEYEKLERVAVFRSPPLSEALAVTLKVSHNLYASTLPLLLAVQEGKRTQRDGMRIEGRILRQLGVDVQGISLESGAGGGDGDRVSPRATVQLLQAMKSRPDFEAYRSALPVLGVDGTLAAAVGKDSPARGKVFAKTGTYTDNDLLNGRSHLRAKSLAGYLRTASGRTLLVALFVNDVPLGKGVTTQSEGRVLGRLCEIVYRHAK